MAVLAVAVVSSKGYTLWPITALTEDEDIYASIPPAATKCCKSSGNRTNINLSLTTFWASWILSTCEIMYRVHCLGQDGPFEMHRRLYIPEKHRVCVKEAHRKSLACSDLIRYSCPGYC